MAITVSHQPDFSLLARAGYQAGAGQFLQQQEAMQQRERMQMRGIRANQLSQQYAAQTGMARDMMRDQSAQNRQFEYQGRNQEFQRGMAEDARDAKAESFIDEMNFRRQLQQSADVNSKEQDANAFLIGQAENAMKGVRESLASGYEFEDGGKAWQGLQEQISKVSGDPTLSPSQRAQIIYRKMFEEAPMPGMKRPSMAKQVNENTFWMEDPDNPGKKVLVGRAREYSALHKTEPEAPEEVAPDFLTTKMVYGDSEQLIKWLKLAREMKTIEKVNRDKDGVEISREEVPPTLAEQHEWIRENLGYAEGGGAPAESGKPSGKPRERTWTPAGIR